jgi:hypothetical protein
MRDKTWRGWGALLIVMATFVMTGCASITEGTEQTVKVETIVDGGAEIPGAQCELHNDKGSFALLSGASTSVRRSGANLTIKCTLAGQSPATGQAISRSNAGMAGNILLGGAIGAAIDVGTGAAYTYPTWIQLVFGQERLFDRSGNRDDGLRVAGTFVRATVEDASTAALASTALAPTAVVPTALAPAPRERLDRRMPRTKEHLDMSMLISRTWVYRHPRDAAAFGNVELSFEADRVYARNAKSATSGTWEVHDDTMCATLDSPGWGRLCFYLVKNGDGEQLVNASSGFLSKLTVR